jgi:hypothetical protein
LIVHSDVNELYRKGWQIGRGGLSCKAGCHGELLEIGQFWSKIPGMNRIERLWRAFLSLPVVLGAAGFALLLLTMLAAVVWVFTALPAQGGLPTAELTIIPGPTSTIYLPTSTSTRVPTITSNMPPSPMPGMIGVGSSVQISGTEGSGLNIRENPGVSTAVLFVALESEVFEVIAGPVVEDEITWWLLVTPLDATRSGWAASNYLTLVSNP